MRLPIGGRGLLTLLLLGAFGWSLLVVDWRGGIIHGGGGAAISNILSGLLRPDLSPDVLRIGLRAAWRTLAYATAGVSLAVLLALPAGVLASGVLAHGRVRRVSSMMFFRSLLGFLRAIHELVWAWLFVAAIGLSPFAAILAIALPYAGILGRILADMLNDVPQAPLQSLRNSGANEWQILLYGRLPMALASMVSYALYRYECGIRSAAIMSFVGLGGLGFEIQISLADLRYNEVWTFVFFLVAMVVAVDVWSSLIRKRMVV